jgi:hypothetical protein
MAARPETPAPILAGPYRSNRASIRVLFSRGYAASVPGVNDYSNPTPGQKQSIGTVFLSPGRNIQIRKTLGGTLSNVRTFDIIIPAVQRVARRFQLTWRN